MSLFGSIDLTRAFEIIVILLISIDIHELAHAIVADRLGDPTPRRLGEISLNPFVHMDQVGILLLLFTSISQYGFTYGRTHITPTNLKFGPQRGNALVAIAGPLSNLALGAVIGIALAAYLRNNPTLDQNAYNVANFLLLALSLNVLLFVFNLLPIPPLDGFSVLGGFLSARQMYALAPLQQWGPMVILILFIADPQIHVISGLLGPAIHRVTQVLCQSCPV